MKKFRNTVKQVSDKFFNEAKQSPQLLADMAKMEYYMAESYSGRLFVELLQNADDAKSTRIILFYKHGNLYFANNGKPFDEQDLNAISRSGASQKKRGTTIGYRGVGFKSASAISNEIIIHSANTYFTFSKEKSAALLGMKAEEVPTIRIPLFLEQVEINIIDDIESLKNNGYSTIFAFKDVDLDLLFDELYEINDGYFMFLNNIYECVFDIGEFQNTYEISRFSNMGSEHVEINYNGATKEWMICKNKNAAIALLIENSCIVPCDEKEAVFHCYLPTLEKSIIACKINADFSTDPSRKHITMDTKTKDALSQVGELISTLLKLAFKDANSGKYKNLLNMYLNKSTTSKLNYFLDEIIEKEVSEKHWVHLANGETISPKEYKALPASFDIEHPESVRIIPGKIANISLDKDVYQYIDRVEEFMGQYSADTIGLDIISQDLSDPAYVKKLNSETHTQLLTNAIRESKIEATLHPDTDIHIQSYIVKTPSNHYDSLKNISNNHQKIDPTLKQELSDRLGESEISWLQKQINSADLVQTIPPVDKITQHAKNNNQQTSDKVHIAKWRDAEIKCVLIEESMGNTATDVSLRNYGYDVKSITPEGKTKYIEVKSVKKDFAFSITNNEYTAAHQYGDDYYICLLLEDGEKLDVRYIQNPLKNATFEKRIKQWEWICLECNSTSMVFDME